jgi:predicted metal-binding membrane protein
MFAGRRMLALNGLVLLAGVGAAWLLLVHQMDGMDAGPTADVGAAWWFAGVWAAMAVAMMLPTATPTLMLVSRIRGSSQVWPFAAGYVLVWALPGVLLAVLLAEARGAAPAVVSWDQRGPLLAGAVLALTALYQLTPLKAACLRRCRSPLGLLVRQRRGAAGSLRAGMGHGLSCVGCCVGLMAALFALGVMSLAWMAVASATILFEKVAPGTRASRMIAVALFGLAVWVAVTHGGSADGGMEMTS